MAIDDVAARGFEARAPRPTRRPGPATREARRRPSPTELGIGRRHRGAATSPPAPASSPGGSSSSGADVVAVEPVAGMREQVRAAVPERRGPRRHRRGDPAARRIGRRRHRRPGVPLVRRRGRSPRSPGCCSPAAGWHVWNERDERSAVGRRDEPVIHWHERTVSRYQHVDWAEVVARVGALQRAEEQAMPLGPADDRELLADRVRSISYIAVDAAGRARAPRRRGERARARRAGAVRPPVRLPRAVVPPTLTEPAARRRARAGGHGAAPRPAVAPHPRPVGGAGVRGDAPADAGRAGSPSGGGRSSTASRRPRRSPPSPPPTSSRVGGPRLQPPGARPAPLRPAVVDEHGGRLPDALDALLALPGIGPYTARGGAGVRLRARRRRGRHQRRPGPRPLAGRRARGRGGAGRRRRRRAARARRGRGTRRCSTSARRVPTRARRVRTCPLAASARGPRPAARRPTPSTARPACRGASAGSRAATARAGAGSSTRCAAARSRARPAAAMGWPDDPDRAGTGGGRRWSPTASPRRRRAPTASA